MRAARQASSAVSGCTSSVTSKAMLLVRTIITSWPFSGTELPVKPWRSTSILAAGKRSRLIT